MNLYSHNSYPQRLVLSTDVGKTLTEELTLLGIERAMIVCSPRLAASLIGQKVRQALGSQCQDVFDRVVEHPTLKLAEDGAKSARSNNIDGLISIGGGSAVDLAKGIVLQLAHHSSLMQLLEKNVTMPNVAVPFNNKTVPIISVPTTLSGAECTPGTGLRDNGGRKLLIREPRCIPRTVLLNPVAIQNVPQKTLISTGINAMAHCIEALYSLLNDPISDAFANEGFVRLCRGLKAILNNPDDAVGCSEALSGAHLAGKAIINARTGIHHAVCHVLGARGVPHGLANAIFLPHAIRFNRDHAQYSLRTISNSIEPESTDPCRTVAGNIRALADQAGLPLRLRDVGIAADWLSTIASDTMHEPGLRYNPRQQINSTEIEQLLKTAW